MNSPYQVQIGAAEEGDELDLRALLAVLWTGKLSLAISVAVVLFIGAVYLIAARPVFTADGLVQVEQNDQTGLSSSMGDLASLFGAPMETAAEIEILQSRMILNKVIDSLDLEIDAQPHYFPLIGRFIARMRSDLEEPAPAMLGLDSFAWGGETIEVATLNVPENLVDEKLTLVAEKDGGYQLLDPDGAILLKGKVGESAADHGVQIFVRALSARPDTRFTLIRYPLDKILKKFSEDLKVSEQGKQSGIISLSYEDYDPERVANVIRHIEDAYVRQNVERRSAEAQQSLDFLQQQLPDIKSRVDAAQARLNAYQMKQGSVDVTKETELVLQQSVDLETKRLELVQQKQQALQRFTAQHPAVQAIDAQIKGIEQEQDQIKKRSSNLPETQQEVLSLMRDLEVNTQIYTTLLNSTQELQVAKAGTVGNVRIIDYPLVPDKAAKPKAALVLAASLVLGVLAGVAYLFLKKSLFHGVDKPDELERALGLATYAAIPYAPTQRRLATAVRRRAQGVHILAAADPTDVAVEALRSFRTSLQFALMEAANNVVMFTGPTPGLGKSFVSVNLGAVLAASGKKVVVIDADLRRGHLHKYIDVSAAPGLSDYVAGNADVVKVIRPTPVPGMSMITNGTTPPNPSELLMHERFAELLQTLSSKFDLVIVDTPPILPVTDAGIVGRLAGSVFMVLKEGEHPMRMVEESVRRLRHAGVQPRGAIFNQVGARGGGYGYYSSYTYSYQSAYQSEKR
ncbi:polysaccharide biosynthesis tyrosine autokinase [Solimonas variicoloris]|uniref:polysaccharide biosynthesis tyrosine autokinase n=1 Tax=Solimonas variicoloris TaxID=254408 RepID=UPI000477CA9F|nr:polysaccharide biosynthesis tyrosine autokinase [Solimonas variicoloris]